MSSEQRERLLETHRYINVDHDDWWDGVYDQFREDMAAVGIDVWNMYFSGFASQGDGACFTGCIGNTELYLNHHHQGQYPMIRKLMENDGELYANCNREGRYYHENATRFWVDADTLTGMMSQPTEFHEQIVEQWQEQLDEELSAFEAEMTEQWRSYMQDLYRRLRAEYDYLTSDEAVWEAIEANELEDDYEDETA